MNEVRRVRIRLEMEELSKLRERVHKIRDDEDRAIAGGVGGSQDASDTLSEVGNIMLVVLGLLGRAKSTKNKEPAS